MGRAEELYARISDEKLAAIDALLTDRASEELFLDFKQAATKAGDRRLHDSDRKNLAKAISGFGNSEGGVIIWGIDCRPGSDGADVPIGRAAIQDVAHFRSLVEGVVSGLTLPSHGNVVNQTIPDETSSAGYVATLIPAAANMPLQFAAEYRYYMRSGSNFVPLPHSVLAGMFGRRPAPSFAIALNLMQPAAKQGEWMTVVTEIAIRHTGGGIAEDTYATMESKTPAGCISIVGSANDPRFQPAYLNGSVISVVAHEAFRLPPGASVCAFSLLLRFERVVRGDLDIDISAGSSNGPPVHHQIRVSESKLNHTLDCFFGVSHADKNWLARRVFGLVDD